VSGERILVLDGPNLNLLGRREPGIYGADSREDVGRRLGTLAETLGCEVEQRQSNHEGRLVDWMHEAWGTFDGIILNPGAFMMYGYALRDAISAIEPPVLEVHISNIYARESFRHHSVLAAVTLGMVSGLGALGYEIALRALVEHLRAAAGR
jgi:3-dehydroquinate dehydratase II